jgi:hypothetical protein
MVNSHILETELSLPKSSASLFSTTKNLTIHTVTHVRSLAVILCPLYPVSDNPKEVPSLCD